MKKEKGGCDHVVEIPGLDHFLCGACKKWIENDPESLFKYGSSKQKKSTRRKELVDLNQGRIVNEHYSN